MEITHKVSGRLFEELAHGTELGERWGYGANVEVDLEVQRMINAATTTKKGFGYQHEMTGSREAWVAIKEYAADRGHMEQTLDGDFSNGLGRALEKQADQIEEMLGLMKKAGS